VGDPFARAVADIDEELHQQVERKTKGLDEILHGIFMVERAGLVIDRLMEERARAKAASEKEPAA